MDLVDVSEGAVGAVEDGLAEESDAITLLPKPQLSVVYQNEGCEGEVEGGRNLP